MYLTVESLFVDRKYAIINSLITVYVFTDCVKTVSIYLPQQYYVCIIHHVWFRS